MDPEGAKEAAQQIADQCLQDADADKTYDEINSNGVTIAICILLVIGAVLWASSGSEKERSISQLKQTHPKQSIQIEQLATNQKLMNLIRKFS